MIFFKHHEKYALNVIKMDLQNMENVMVNKYGNVNIVYENVVVNPKVNHKKFGSNIPMENKPKNN